MFQEDEALAKWANLNLRSKVTLGQLVSLLELLGSDSVAAISRGSTSHAVNYRQKLDRLEAALGLGPLTRRSGKTTQVNDLGQQVAGEVRLLLRELKSLAHVPMNNRIWYIGAGDAWLQSVIVPALAKIAASGLDGRWEVRNLRMTEIVRALKEGRLHFGFVRAADLSDEDGLQRVRIYSGSTLSMLAGDAATAPAGARDFLQWLEKNRCPLVQQGTTWRPVSEQVARVIGLKMPINILEPAVICETHSQAAAAAIQSASWCIVPTNIARLFSNKKSRMVEIGHLEKKDDMVLVTHKRHIDKIPGIAEVQDILKRGLGAVMPVETSRAEL